MLSAAIAIKMQHHRYSFKIDTFPPFLSSSSSPFYQRLGCCTMLSASIAMKMQHLRYKFFDLIYGINFWQGSIKSVEGLFGTGVGSYFRFLKWLFLLNIPIFLVCFSFVTIPQLVHDFTNNSTAS